MDVRVGFWMGEWDAGGGLTQCALAILQGCHDHFGFLHYMEAYKKRSVSRSQAGIFHGSIYRRSKETQLTG